MVGKVKFMLTDAQINKIGTAFKRHDGVTLKLNLGLMSPSGVPIILTESEKQLLRDGMNHNIHISFTRLKEMGSSWVRSGSKVGGILPLIPIIMAALAATSLAGGAAAGISRTVKNAKEIANEKLKTEAMIENEKRKTDAYIAAAQGKPVGSGLRLGRGKNGGFFPLLPAAILGGMAIKKAIDYKRAQDAKTGGFLPLIPAAILGGLALKKMITGKGLHLQPGKGLYLRK